MANPTTPPMTRDEVLALPAVVIGLETIRRALGLSKAEARRQAASGELPGLLSGGEGGERVRVSSAALLAALGLDPTGHTTGDPSRLDGAA